MGMSDRESKWAFVGQGPTTVMTNLAAGVASGQQEAQRHPLYLKNNYYQAASSSFSCLRRILATIHRL